MIKMPKKQHTLKHIQFTEAGLKKVKDEYAAILATRKEAVAILKAARELGDLSENGLYKAARGRLSSLDNQLFRLETMIKLAKIEEVKVGVIGIGSRVTVFDGKKEIDYTVVGGYESDPVNRYISLYSPIGSALLGKKVGETATINVPAGVVTYKVVRIA